jgi:hypothetical protein
MRIALILSGVLMLVFVSAALPADDGGAKKDDAASGVIHRPQDVAPPDLVIVPRPASDYRPEGSLLSQAAHQPRMVDLDELARRKQAQYAGETFTGELPVPGCAAVASVPPTPMPPQDVEERGMASVFYWSVTGAMVLAAFWLTLKACLYLMRDRVRTQVLRRNPR